MKTRSHAGIVVGIVALALMLPVVAHHGAAGLFDQTLTVELKGAVKRWSFVNPHPILLLETTDESGQTVEWDIYFGPAAASALQRRGITAETFTIGETLTIKGHPALAEGVRGLDVFGAEGRVTREDGSRVP